MAVVVGVAEWVAAKAVAQAGAGAVLAVVLLDAAAAEATASEAYRVAA